MAGHRVESGTDRLRCLQLRSRQRGLRETCVVLGEFAMTRLTAGDPDLLDAFEALLARPDQEILDWLLGLESPPESLATIIAVLRQDRIRSNRAI